MAASGAADSGGDSPFKDALGDAIAGLRIVEARTRSQGGGLSLFVMIVPGVVLVGSRSA